MNRLIFGCLVGLAVAGFSFAEEPEKTREERIAAYLTGSKFVGRYTTDKDKDAAAKQETYSISKVEKLPEADMYRLTSRIQYGGTDSEVPMDLKILWAGSTPVITLDNVWVPGLGTFSARVLIHDGRYSGTWSHDDVGGHLFGKIIK
jgi:hypothetical protein